MTRARHWRRFSFMMAMSSCGDYCMRVYRGENVKAKTFITPAEYYLTHGLSPANCKWPNIPFPYNTFIYSGSYNRKVCYCAAARDVAQPDKAGSFGLEQIACTIK